MRLKLVVRRHNLPDAAVTWSIEPSDNPTISQLLEQVNEVFPLESGGDWGLEDYSVEIKGSDTNFECLHFQLVRTILHEDDEILIRPLLSHDLKLRKLSGRRQISFDGKHLFDGLVFGRPRPRGPVDRPAVEIPPRKRRRITYYHDADSSVAADPLSIGGQAQITSDPDGNYQLTISADFEDDDEDDDEDFEPTEEDDVEDFDADSSSIDSDVSSHRSSDGPSNEKKDEENDDLTSSEGSDTSTPNSIPGSDSHSNSNSEPDEVSSRPTDLAGNAAVKTQSPANNTPKEPETQKKVTMPPGQGKNSTRKRNQRRRTANLLQRFKEKGTLPAGTTIQDLNQLGLDENCITEDTPEALAGIRIEGSQKSKRATETAAAKAAEFEARRRQLLASLASGGVEVGSQPLSESLIFPYLDPVSVEDEMSHRILIPVTTDFETPLKTAIDKVTESIDAATVEHDAASFASPIAGASAETLAKSPVMPTGSTMAESASRPRRKIDLGAAGRLLFGALGVRAPKTKADHEKVRNDLMKDIRPSKAVPVGEAVTKEVQSVKTDEDPEAWREIINLRAVECCYDGVVLTPAPFPFVQRWDPQQQGSHSKQRNRGGKGKRSQRNQSEYYDDEQPLLKKRKRNRNSYDTYYDSYEQYLDADAAENEEHDHRDELVGMEPINAPDMQIMYNDGIEGAVNDQIMKDVHKAATSQAMDEDDLPRLPKDISMLPDFTDDGVKPGMVIGFKQLILSEATNWQPQMSTYRTAVVIKASENGYLELRLAKRDRKQMEKYYNAETGERIYGKFDMPTDDDQDDDEDDGFLEVTINEIVDPKIIQLAPESLGAPASLPDVAHNKATTSENDSTNLGHANSAETSKTSVEAPGEAEEETTGHQDLPVDSGSPSIRRADFPADDAEETLAFSISEDAREEISELIKEAGFRTTVPSSVLRAQTRLPATPCSNSDKGAYSPRFNGFGSSSSIQALSTPSYFNPTTPLTEDAHDTIGSNGHVLEIKSTVSTVRYPKLSVPSSLASQVSDRGRQPDYSIPGDDTLHQFDELDSFLGNREELPVNTDQDLPCAPSVNASDNTPSNHIRHIPSEAEPPSSGGRLTLAEVFSTARSSVGPKFEAQPWLSQKTKVKDATRIEDSYNKEMEALDAMLEEAEDVEQTTPRSSQNHQGDLSTALAVSQKESGSQFKIPPGSQQVDLTFSSDVELGAEKENASDGSYDDDYGLPRGPGWVEKKTRRTRRQTTGNSQALSQRVTKVRTSRKKTMTRF